MNLEIQGANIYINANKNKTQDSVERKLVEVATELMILHRGLGIYCSGCEGEDCKEEYYTHLLCSETNKEDRKFIRSEWKDIKKIATIIVKG